MVRKIVLDNEITLWWEYLLDKSANAFHCYINGEKYATVKTTHITYKDLTPDTEYKICIEADDGKVIFDESITTKPVKNKIDVTKAPYYAVGDGVTLNTQALQRAFDDCTETDYVYIPQGTFLTGGLRAHSDFEQLKLSQMGIFLIL